MWFLLWGHGPRAALTHFYMGTFIGIHTFIYCAHKHPPPPHTLAPHLLPSAEPAPSLRALCCLRVESELWAEQALSIPLQSPGVFFICSSVAKAPFFVNFLVKLKMWQSQEQLLTVSCFSVLIRSVNCLALKHKNISQSLPKPSCLMVREWLCRWVSWGAVPALLCPL